MITLNKEANCKFVLGKTTTTTTDDGKVQKLDSRSIKYHLQLCESCAKCQRSWLWHPNWLSRSAGLLDETWHHSLGCNQSMQCYSRKDQKKSFKSRILFYNIPLIFILFLGVMISSVQFNQSLDKLGHQGDRRHDWTYIYAMDTCWTTHGTNHLACSFDGLLQRRKKLCWICGALREQVCL